MLGAILGDWSWTSVALGIGAILVGAYIPTLRNWIATGIGGAREKAEDVIEDVRREVVEVIKENPDLVPHPARPVSYAVGKRAEMFAIIRAHCLLVGGEEAVKPLDSVAMLVLTNPPAQ